MIEDPTELLQELVQTPSVSGDEEDMASTLLDVLADTPFTTELLEDTVVAHHGDTGPLVVLHAHIDTVPAGDGWTHPPTGPDAGVIEDGDVYGLGAADNKASIVSVLLAAGGLLQEDCQLVLVFPAREEVDGSGTQQALAWLQEGFDTAEAMAVVTEPTGCETVGTGCMGSMFLEVTADTGGGHAAMDPDSPITAITDAVKYLDGEDDSSATITAISAGSDAPNQVPNTAEATIDVRTGPAIDQDDLMAEITGMDGIATIEHTADPCPAAVCDDDAVIDAVTATTGADPTSMATSDDSCFFNDAGIPAVVYGPGDMDQAHSVDEHVAVQKVQKAAKDLIGIVEAWTP